MYTNNPFQSWTQGSSGQTAPSQWENSTPTIFGALPYPSDPSVMTSYFFTAFNPNIFNCNVVGPKNQPHYRIVTDNTMPGYTAVQDAAGKNVALIEWQKLPAIEIRGMVPKQHVMTWLRLCPNRDSRAMEVRGVKYFWVPRDKTINLYAASSTHTPTFMARINRANGAIVLEIAPEAMHAGLLEPTITACFLLQCGRNIDQ
ncbi:hypothetical protein DFP72DRAFT_1097034 [Ephemerocybe angulata]|uniref:DUF6593 domain-containing protein n=1 Tax=Ephemerocybe angulata TaxID=980116 RepID=A0A8H6MCN6_9AGAR|nr:hypothetical protein DFP72DRAFT_1097034 [Tulosesus angulatus]